MFAGEVQQGVERPRPGGPHAPSSRTFRNITAQARIPQEHRTEGRAGTASRSRLSPRASVPSRDRTPKAKSQPVESQPRHLPGENTASPHSLLRGPDSEGGCQTKRDHPTATGGVRAAWARSRGGISSPFPEEPFAVRKMPRDRRRPATFMTGPPHPAPSRSISHVPGSERGH